MDFFEIRVFFKKQGDARFISHLDLSRFMQRALKRSRLPLWHTEGFNPHPYVTFALPLSLGQTGLCESMDFRLTEPMDEQTVFERLSACMPRDIILLKAAKPFCKAKEIDRAQYSVTLYDAAELAEKAGSFFELDSIIVTKNTKKGGSKDIDLKPLIYGFTVNAAGENLLLTLLLPTGSELNINPSLVINAFASYCETEFCPVSITRTKILTKSGKVFE